MRFGVATALRGRKFVESWIRYGKDLGQAVVRGCQERLRAWMLEHAGACFIAGPIVLLVAALSFIGAVNWWNANRVYREQEARQVKPVQTRVQGNILEIVREIPNPDTPRP